MKQNKSFWTFSTIISILGAVLSYLIISLLNKLVPDVSVWVQVLVVLPVFVFVVGQIRRKHKSRKV
ncbi:MAG: hypothetical protein HQ521_02200 [Bacteroidetes bacterium]|nr:hypothetical protein [Bacteroidota bacterium]